MLAYMCVSSEYFIQISISSPVRCVKFPPVRGTGDLARPFKWTGTEFARRGTDVPVGTLN